MGEYRLPFEEEVGSHLSLEDMQQAVVHKKIRPILRTDWFYHKVRHKLIPRAFSTFKMMGQAHIVETTDQGCQKYFKNDEELSGGVR